MGRGLSISATEILTELHRRGVELSAAGDRLRFRPKDAVPPNIMEGLKRRKAEILSILQFRQSGTGFGLCPGPEKCAGCYQVGARADGSPIYLHPPKGKPIDWTAWKPATEKLQ